jgi:hypothetical protein
LSLDLTRIPSFINLIVSTTAYSLDLHLSTLLTVNRFDDLTTSFVLDGIKEVSQHFHRFFGQVAVVYELKLSF